MRLAPWAVRALTRLADALAKARRALIPRQYAALELGTMSWVSHALAAFCALRLADELAHGAKSAADLANGGRGDARVLERLLRSLSAYDVVKALPDGRYALGRSGKALVGPASVAPMVLYANAQWHAQAHLHLAQALRARRTAFTIAHDATLFDYLQKDSEASKLFNDAMRAMNALYGPAFAAAYDFANVASVIDIGGGDGALMEAVAAKNADLDIAVFDLPDVVREGTKSPRIRFIAGDIFKEMPPPADCYVLSHVLHDWNDDACAAILRNVRAAMRPGSRLLIYELLVDKRRNVWSQDRLSDLEMLAMLGGKERALEELEQLLTRCGLRVTRVYPAGAPEAVIECVPGETPDR